jgi:hypothetical protein
LPLRGDRHEEHRVRADAADLALEEDLGRRGRIPAEETRAQAVLAEIHVVELEGEPRSHLVAEHRLQRHVAIGEFGVEVARERDGALAVGNQLAAGARFPDRDAAIPARPRGKRRGRGRDEECRKDIGFHAGMIEHRSELLAPIEVCSRESAASPPQPETTMKRYLAIAAAAFAFPALATTHSTDYTDLWYLPAESGWGVNVVQQNDIVFATFFVYGPDGTPRWYVAPDTRSVSSPVGQNTFTGSLYSTTGTYFGAPWTGTAFAQVGSVSFAFSSPTTGAVSYTVNGVNVTKSITRQTWAANNLTGNYIGGLTANGTGCRNGVSNGPILIHGELTIGHSNFANPLFRVDFTTPGGLNATCNFQGTYGQEGKLGRVTSGTFNCTIAGVSNPPVGTFTLTQVQANVNGMTSRFAGADQNCNYDGYFGGIKDVL